MGLSVKTFRLKKRQIGLFRSSCEYKKSYCFSKTPLIMGGGAQPHGIPDWRIYSQDKVAEVPELMKHKQRLAALGLKDPWIRNEIWKFMPTNEHVPWYAGPWKVMLRGFGKASAAMLLTIAIDKWASSGKPSKGH